MWIGEFLRRIADWDIYSVMQMTWIGGPTVLVEWEGLRFLTDPTFDAAGSEITYGEVTLRKTAGPAVTAAELGRVDAVLLSHDQHFDNLDGEGRRFLPQAGTVLTTKSGAARLGGNAMGLAAWESMELRSAEGERRVKVTGTPARHGPEGIEPISGEVTGFVLSPAGGDGRSVYVTGDTVWYEGVAEVAKRFAIGWIVLFAGAARLKARGPAHLTMDARDAVMTARAFPEARVIPVHHHGWEHFSEGQADLERAFRAGGLEDRLQMLEPGRATGL